MKSLNNWTVFILVLFLFSVYGFNIKLIDVKEGSTAKSGRVWLSRDGVRWGGVQPIGWNNKESNVICRMFGYKHGEAISLPRSGKSSALNWATCSGNEVSFWDCNLMWSSDVFMEDDDSAGVRCFNTSIKIMRYSPLEVTNAGSVLIYEDFKWRAVCDTEWDDMDATVACRQAGFKSGKSLCCSKLTFEQQLGDPFQKYQGPEMTHYGFKNFDTPFESFVTKIRCSTDSTDLQSCSKTININPCSRKSLASVICYKTDLNKVDNHLAVRFTNGSHGYGKLQVRRFGQWGDIFSPMRFPFGDASANVSCKMMGYKGGVALTLQSKHVDLPYWISQANCTGTENSLANCSVEWGTQQAKDRSRFNGPAGAICYKHEPPKLLLRNGTSRMGRVELDFDGVRGTICESIQSNGFASVACKQLGFKRGSRLAAGSFGLGSGPVFMTTGDGCKTSIWQCWVESIHWFGKKSSVEKMNSLAVSCENDVRLSGGKTLQSGIVQVYKDDDDGWRSVSSEGFGTTEANIVCKELGYNQGQVLPPGTFGESKEELSTVKYFCSEQDTSLSNCVTFYKTSTESDKRLYGAVQCYNSTHDTNNTLELISATTSASATIGELAVSYHGFTGQICAEHFGEKEASVACGELGYNYGWTFNRRSKSGAVEFAIQKLSCQGTENSIFDCLIGIGMCSGSYGNAGVVCYNSTAPVLKLVTTDTVKVLTWYTGRETVCSTAKQLCKLFGSSSTMTPRNPCKAPEDSIIQCTPTDSINIYKCQGYPSIESCTRGVRLVGREDSVQPMSGRIEVMVNSKWTAVAKRIDSYTTGLVCRELGASYHRTLPVNVFSPESNEKHVTIICEGGETTLSECLIKENKEYLPDNACIVCSSSPIDDSIKVEDVHLGFNTNIKVTQYNITGFISSSSWTDTHSSILCKSNGFSDGKTIGEIDYSSDNSRIVYIFACDGEVRDISQCSVSSSSIINIRTSSPANVFCFDDPDDFSTRLSDQTGTGGFVQIHLLGSWTNICMQNGYLSTSLINSICREKGFASGTMITPSESGSEYPVLFQGITRCFSLPLWQCYMKNVTKSVKCVSGSSLLAVQCEKRTTTERPSTTTTLTGRTTTLRRPWHGHHHHGNNNSGASTVESAVFKLVFLLILLVIY